MPTDSATPKQLSYIATLLKRKHATINATSRDRQAETERRWYESAGGMTKSEATALINQLKHKR